jgi:hypothetical protein
MRQIAWRQLRKVRAGHDDLARRVLQMIIGLVSNFRRSMSLK